MGYIILNMKFNNKVLSIFTLKGHVLVAIVYSAQSYEPYF